MLCNSSTCRLSRLLTAPVLSSTGGLFYDVHGVSRTGTPRGHARGGVPVFGSAPVKSVRRAASAKRCVAALAHLHLVGPTLPLPLSRTAGARRARLEDTAQETASICACRTRARRVARRGGGRQPSAQPTRPKTSHGQTWQKCTGVGRCGRPQRRPCEARSGQAATPSQAALGGRLNQTGKAAAAAPLAMATAPTLTIVTRWSQEDNARNLNAFLGRGWTKCVSTLYLIRYAL